MVESITGHLSRRMLEHYSHIRLKAKKASLDPDMRLMPQRKRLAHHTSNPPKPPGRNDMKHTS